MGCEASYHINILYFETIVTKIYNKCVYLVNIFTKMYKYFKIIFYNFVIKN